MAALSTQMWEALKADELLAPHVGIRIYNNRPIKRKGAGSTPEAFDENGRVRFSIVVMDEGGIGNFNWDNVSDQSITVWTHGPLTPETFELMSGLAYERILALMDHEYTTTNETGIDIEPGDRFGVQENPAIANSYVDYLRFSLTRLWR